MAFLRTHGMCPSGMWGGVPGMSLVRNPVLAHAGNTGGWTVDMDGETIRGMRGSALCC